MKVLHIVGADLSKKTIDFATPQADHLKVSNDQAGYHQLVKWLKEQKINIQKMMIVIEHTGLYSYRLEHFLHEHQFKFTKVPALAIKRSMGLVRGKNDKIDAIRIARYGYEKRDQLVEQQSINESLERLQMLHSTRRRLVRHRAAFVTAIKEYKDNCELNQKDLIMQSQLRMIKEFDQEISKIELEIRKVLKAEKKLKDNAELLQSITGVGEVVSVATIIKTGNFTKFTKARKFACHCGTAPFENTSGTSIRGKTRVSHLADKEMKTLLEQSARSAIQYDKELREFYRRRLAAGKSKTSTLNVVRNKILFRMFAVIKRQTPFIKDYLQSA
jgi:transposase